MAQEVLVTIIGFIILLMSLSCYSLDPPCHPATTPYRYKLARDELYNCLKRIDTGFEETLLDKEKGSGVCTTFFVFILSKRVSLTAISYNTHCFTGVWNGFREDPRHDACVDDACVWLPRLWA